MMVALRQALAHHARQQREVVVLHQHDRVVGARLVRDHVGEAPVHRAGSAPSRARGRSAACARCGTAATGPRWRSRSSSPAPPRASARRAGCGTTDAPAAPSRGRCLSTVSRSAEPLPCAIQVPEQARITGSSAVTRPLAGRWISITLSVVPHVDVRLAVRDDQHLVALQVLAQDAAQRVRAPAGLALVARAALAFEVAHQRLQVARDRPQLRRGRRASRSASAAAPSPRSSALMPATQPRQLISAMTTVISATTAAIAGEQVQHVLARVLAAPLREAHVVHDHQLAEHRVVGGDRVGGHVQRAVGELEHEVARLAPIARRAAHRLRVGRRWRKAACRLRSQKPSA